MLSLPFPRKKEVTSDSMSGTIMTISKDRVKPSLLPDSWKLGEIFATGIVIGTYLAIMTVIFFWAVHATDFFEVTRSVTNYDCCNCFKS